MSLRSALCGLLSSLRLEFSMSVGLTPTEAEPTPLGGCYAATERAQAYPIGFGVEPIE